MKKFIPLALVATALIVGCGSGEDAQLETQAPPPKEGAVAAKPRLGKKMPSNNPTGTGAGPVGSNVQKPAQKPPGM